VAERFRVQKPSVFAGRLNSSSKGPAALLKKTRGSRGRAPSHELQAGKGILEWRLNSPTGG